MISNLTRQKTRGDGLQQLCAAFYSKILVWIRNMRRKCRSSAQLDEGGYIYFNTDIPNTVSTGMSLWTYRIMKSLALRPTSLSCEAKAFLGIWTELVNLLTLQLGICGFMRLIPAWLCCYLL